MRRAQDALLFHRLDTVPLFGNTCYCPRSFRHGEALALHSLLLLHLHHFLLLILLMVNTITLILTAIGILDDVTNVVDDRLEMAGRANH